MSFTSNSLKIITPVYVSILLLTSIFVFLLPWWPEASWLITPKYLLLFGPRWWLFLVVVLSFALWRCAGNKSKSTIVLSLLISINYLDFQLPSANYVLSSNSSDAQPIKILTANVGGGGSMHEIQLLMNEYAPDILVLQEAKQVNVSTWFSDEYRGLCGAGLCMVSKVRFEKLGTLNRKLIDGWGDFAHFYKFYTSSGDFVLGNVHMETPRSAIMGVIGGVWKAELASQIDKNRALEASLLSTWSQGQERVVLAGDFNMLEDENIYHKYFSHMTNAIGDATWGLNYTKHTNWHGARIDHVLSTNNFNIKSAEVINAITGDHRPVFVTLQISE